jgi:hypothetical protein
VTPDMGARIAPLMSLNGSVDNSEPNLKCLNIRHLHLMLKI